MRILVSGFEPFLDEKVNPSAEIVRFVTSQARKEPAPWPGLDVHAVLLPVEFDRAFQVLEKERLAFAPDMILSFGLAGGRTAIEVERVAVNFRGESTGAIDLTAPLSLETTLPVNAILQKLRAAEIPTRESFSAGTYVCNDLFFQMQYRLRYTRVRSGFIHVPRLSDEWPWSRFETAVRAILLAV